MMFFTKAVKSLLSSVFLLSLLTLAACGQKGPLILPEPDQKSQIEPGATAGENEASAQTLQNQPVEPLTHDHDKAQ